jgi:hypothetical protein
LFAFLFGGGRDEEEDATTEAPQPRRGWAGNRTQVGAAPSRGAPTQVASADSQDGGRNLFVAQAYRGETPRPIQQAERNLPRGETYMSPGPAAAPQANMKVAAPEAKEPATDSAGDAAIQAAALPMPPRRPSELTTASIPLPPTRPVQLALIATPAPRPVAAYAAATPLLDGGSAIRGLIGATQGAREPRKAGLPSVITEGASKSETAPAQSVALAYAPAGGATTGLRAVALGRPYLSKEAIGRPADFVPARLDRSNFRALTGSAPAARMTTQSVLGPAVAAPRAAARADFAPLAGAPSAGYVSGFGRVATDLPTSSFAPRAMNMARATIN